jgi:hypothetical protein
MLGVAVNGSLIRRATRARQKPQELTSLGARLAAQADKPFGVHPQAPVIHPGPLRTALRAIRGAEKIAVFLAVVKAGSVTSASRRLHCRAYDLRHTLRALEEALGTDLAGPGIHELELTETARRLRRQAKRAGFIGRGTHGALSG